MKSTLSIILWLFVLSLLHLHAKPASFRFVQLTDIHLDLNGLQPTKDLEYNIERINKMEGLEFVLVTGDITNAGDRATMQRTKDMLAKLRYPYYIIMGNHETKWSESGCTAWTELFGYDRFEAMHHGIHFLGFNTGPLMRMAYGHVVKQDLDWLEQRLSTFPKDEPVIIVTHYPLTKDDVDNWYEATDLLRRFNVRLCIGGHYHTWNNLSYDGIPGVLAPSTCSDASHKAAFCLYEVDADSIHISILERDKAPQAMTSYAMHGAIKDCKGRVLDPKGGAEEYPDTTDNVRYGWVKPIWLLHNDASIYSTPAVDKTCLYVGDDAGAVTAYRLADGRRMWQFRTAGRIFGTPAVWKGTLVVGSADGGIYGLRAKDGSLLWKVKADAPVLGAVTIDKGVAYIGASDHRMRAIDVRSGRVVWTYEGVDGYIETRPLVTAENVIFGAWDTYLYNLSRKDGSLLWKWNSGKAGMHYSPAAVWPVEANGRVFIADPERALTAINLKDGQTVWRTRQSMVRETVGVSADRQRIYSKTMNDSLVCYSTEGNVPHELWATDVGFGYEHAPSMPQELEGTVYGGTKTGLVYAVDAKSGRLLWRHHVGHSLINTVLPLKGRRVVVTSSDGQIGILREGRH